MAQVQSIRINYPAIICPYKISTITIPLLQSQSLSAHRPLQCVKHALVTSWRKIDIFGILVNGVRHSEPRRVAGGVGTT
jgi:hypothetical protein